MQKLLSLFFKLRHRRIKKFIYNPHHVQKRVLKKLLYTAKNTLIGKKYAFHSIDSIYKFKYRMPVCTYEAFYPYIQKILHGEQHVLWPTPIHWFAKSSGTTNDHSKYIPISKQAIHQGHYKAAYDMLALYIQQISDTQIFNGKNISILNALVPASNFSATKIHIGDISTILYKNMPAWVRKTQIISDDILISPWEDKIKKIITIAAKQNVVSLTGIPTWIWRLLETILQKNQTKYIHNIWPKLELFIHGAVSFKPYQGLFDTIMDKKINYLEVYNATEGFFAFQDNLKQKDMLLLLDHGIFYEFIPIEELNNEHPTTIPLEDVALHQIYALVITTNAGLWRYLIGDTIVFTKKNPYKIRIVGRTKQFINIFGEELIVENAEKALAVACKQTEATLCNYTAGPIYMDKNKNAGGHEWFIEFYKQPNNLDNFLHIFDQNLKKINTDYKIKRNSHIMYTPKIRVLPKGTFYQWMAQKGKLGGQSKVPRLANHRKYLSKILTMLEEKKD